MQKLSKHIGEAKPHYDAIVIGSGYGGGVSASRLARCGQSVCVLERGKEFLPGDFPDRMGEGYANIQINNKHNRIGSDTALFDLHTGKDIHVLVGCGLGGTSLINANVALEAEPKVFEDKAWPKELREGSALSDGYARARQMLNPVSTPVEITNELPKFAALEKSAVALGKTVTRVPINVTFEGQSNHAGVFQPGCTLCGDCCSGCNYGSKNTTHMNYLPDAVNHGAELFTHAKVDHIRKDNGRWHVFYRISGTESGFDAPLLSLTSDLVVLSAGALGSTEILLRSTRQGLELSEKLGERFTGNGDVLAFGYNNDDTINGIGVGVPPKAETGPVGPCITGAIDLRNQDDLRKSMIIEEGSIPGVLSPILPTAFASGNVLGQDTDFSIIDELSEAGRVIQSLLRGAYAGAVNNTQTYLVMSHDDGKGRIQLNGQTANVVWPGVARQKNFALVDQTLRAATAATGGSYIKNPISHPLLSENLITVHPLGGCAIGTTVKTGVVNHKCQVFNPAGESGKAVHDGLYVCDGSIIPRPLGVNPLLTITALSERAMQMLADDRGWSFDTAAKVDAPHRDAAAEQQSSDKIAGIQFTEKMEGFWSSEKLDDHDAAWKHGKSERNSIHFILTVTVEDIDRFIADPNHAAQLSGSVAIPTLSSEPLTVSNGRFNLFSDDPEAVDQKNMLYSMTLTSTEGESYIFKGQKNIHDDPGLDVWQDTTRLFTDLYGADGTLIGKGVLRIRIGDFLTQLRTMQGIGGSGLPDRAGAMLKFGKLFGHSIFSSYAGLIAPLHRYDVHNTRKKRELRTGDPEIHWFETEDGLTLRLSRYQGGTKGPVIFSHGLGVSSGIFSLDTINTNLLEYLYSAGYDCWLLDYRASIDLPYADEPYTADEIAKYDYPAAIKTVQRETGAEDVQIVAHCYGGTTFSMAMLNGLQHVRSAVISQISVDVLIPWWPQRILAHLRLPSILGALGITHVDAKAKKRDTFWLKALDRLIRIILPTQLEERSQSATSNRITMLYGSLYEHDQLNAATYEFGLPQTFGVANIAAFRHLAKIGRRKHIVNAKGEDVYRPHLDRFAIPVRFIHGAENACFSPESTRKTLDNLRKNNGASLYDRKEIAGYGHIDCIFGKDAATDVYPHILEHLEKTA